MSWSEIATLSLSVLVVVTPIGGNIGIVVAQRKGWKGVEDFLTRWTPIALAASKSKSTAEAVEVLIDHVLQLEAPESSSAKLAAIAVIRHSKRPPPKSASAAIATKLSLCLVFLCGCQLTPAQSAAIAAHVPKIAGAVCDAVDAATDSVWVTVVCKALDIGKPPAAAGAPAPIAEIRMKVPRSQLKKFLAENGGPQ